MHIAIKRLGIRAIGNQYRRVAAGICWITPTFIWAFLIITNDTALAEEHIRFKDNEVTFFDYDERFPALIVPVEVNGVQVNAILDTGANYLILDDDFEDMLGVPLDPNEVYRITGFKPSQQTAITHTGRVKVDYFRFPDVRLGTRPLFGSVSISKDLDFISSVMGRKIGAIIGADQLARMAVFFDSGSNRVILAESVKHFDFPSSEFERADLSITRTGLPIVLGNFDNVNLPLLVDTGTNSFASLDRSSVEELRATEKPVFEMTATVQSTAQASKVRLRSMKIAGRDFKSQLFDLGAFNSLGFAALAHSDFILSMPDKSLYLREPRIPLDRGEVDKSGLRLLTQQGAIVVFQSSEDGPAFASGLRTNDKITKFNSKPVNAEDVWNIRNTLRGQPGDEIEIEFDRGGKAGLARFELSSDTMP